MTDTTSTTSTSTTQTTEAATASVASTKPYFCPICGTLLEQGYLDGLLCWICPQGDYWEPI